MVIGIVGQGIVGKALKAYYERKHEVLTFDKADGIGDAGMADADVVFVCVGTPSGRDGLDCVNVWDAVGALVGKKTVIIKSTVMPGTTDALAEKYPQHTFFFVPEFLSDATAAEDFANPRRPHILGYTRGNIDDSPIRTLLPKWGTVETIQLLARQAELLKLATNAFYALKVTYANMLYDVGMTQETLDALAADPWIAASHFKVEHKGYRGYGGKCLPKDTDALKEYGWPFGEGDLSHLCALMKYYNADLRGE